MRTLNTGMVLLLLIPMVGCAAHYTNESMQDPYGFFSGFWHGLIFIFALIASVISWVCSLVGVSFLASVELIGRPNTGFGYYVGFAIGLVAAGDRRGKY